MLHIVQLCLFLLVFANPAATWANASGKGSTFAKEFRLAEPFLVQDIVVSHPIGPDARRVLLLTEPPSAAFQTREAWIPRLFGSDLLDHSVAEHPIGFDGFSRDIVIETTALSDQQIARAVEAIHREYFGTDYKAAYRLFEPKSWNKHSSAPRRQGPENLEVSASSLHSWLYGETALRFSSDPFDTQSPNMAEVTLADLRLTKSGVFYSQPAGLVLMRVAPDQMLNELTPLLRRFFVDTDTLIGAIEQGSALVLVGRERTTPIDQMPPLRIDTVLTLAASGTTNLAQSYQRSMPFAGAVTDPELARTLHQNEIVAAFADIFGIDGNPKLAPPDSFTSQFAEQLALEVMVDWAPILLSRELTHTEYGQLLNITDQMLKGWSSANRIEYVRFGYPKPYGNPDAVGIFQRLQNEIETPFNQLTFNWNTSGYGTWTEIDGIPIFTLARTGSLPVSYFPDDGSFVIEGAAEATIQAAEDDYWAFFAGLRDPYLARAAQYAALHVIFQAHPVAATRTEPLVDLAAYDARWSGLTALVEKALQSMAQHVRQGTHPLDNTQAVSDFGEGTIVDPAQHCHRNLDNRYLWNEDPALAGPKDYLGTLSSWNLPATLLTDPAVAFANVDARIAAFISREETYDEKVEAFNARARLCNQTQTCSPVTMDYQRSLLESEERALDQEVVLINGMQDTLLTSMDKIRGIDRHIADFGDCTAAWSTVVRQVPPVDDAVYKTPGIVLSNDPSDLFSVGGHNLDGRSVRVLEDAAIAPGKVNIDAQSGVIRLNPADIGRAQTVARAFERDHKRFITGNATLQARVTARVEASLAQDTRALQAFDDLALARPNAPMPGARGAQVAAAPEAAPGGHVVTRPAAIQLEPTAAAELAAFSGNSSARGVVRQTGDGLIEISLPGGRPPVAIRVARPEDIAEAMTELGSYATRGARDSSTTIQFIDKDNLLSLGDMNAIKYSAVGRQSAAGGAGGGLPPVRTAGAAPPPPPGGPGGPRGFFAGGGGKDGGGFRLSAFLTQRGNAANKLLRTDADWANAVVQSVAIRAFGDSGGTLTTSISLSFKAVETAQPSTLARVIASFRKRQPTEADAQALKSAIDMVRARGDEVPLWQQLEAIRIEFQSTVGSGETPRLMWHLQDTADDFFVVEDRNEHGPRRRDHG
jgi:hypothetical protein